MSTAVKIQENDTMSPDLPEALRKAPLFANLPPDDLRRVAEIASPRRFAKKESVFREGERADGFFVVAQGRVKVFKLSVDGKEQVLHLIGPGQSFAEATIFEGGTYPAHAEALEDRLSSPKRPLPTCWKGIPDRPG
jgi:CRP/FNR family transcriptional regulator